MSSLKTDVDIAALRRRLVQRGQNYWRSLDELAGTTAFQDFLQHEFPQLKSLWDSTVDRRRALQLMAASLALAGLGCEKSPPPEKILPYVNMPENLVPGRPLHFASTLTFGGYGEGIVGQCREGRPVKLEGNPQHPSNLGASNLFMQAALLDLYDPARSQTPTWRGQAMALGRFQQELDPRRSEHAQRKGRGLCVLTESISSPSQGAALQALLRNNPEARWFVHDPVSRRNAYQGTALAFGEALETRYRFDKASVVLSLDGDFLGSLPGHLRYVRDFIRRRRTYGDGSQGNRLYVAESTPTITGASADHRLSLAASQMMALADGLARRLGIALPHEPFPLEEETHHWLDVVAEDLSSASRSNAALVLTGDHQPPELHALVQVINVQLGSVGNALVHTQPVLQWPERENTDLAALCNAIDAGEVDTLLILGGNPAYSAPAALNCAKLLTQVPFSVHFGEYLNETARCCTWHLPACHELESWGDGRAFDGTVSFTQPLVRPLYQGLTPLQVLAIFNQGRVCEALPCLQDYWRQQMQAQGTEDFTRTWKQALQNGVLQDSALPTQVVSLRQDWQNALKTLSPANTVSTHYELQLRPDPCIGDGRHAGNAWLQELPKPITLLSWSNAALLAPALADALNVRNGQKVRLELNGKTLDAPVWIQPGQPPNSVLLHMGYGHHTEGIAFGLGVDAFQLQPADGTTFTYGLRIHPLRQTKNLVTTQHHHSMEGLDLVRQITLQQFREDLRTPPLPEQEHPSLYPPHTYPDQAQPEHAWAMTVDLTACIGCNACTLACQAENNIPVVGPEELARGHGLHWLRVDRYYTGPVDAPGVRFQPVPCMHCENAPCESVCPVEATLHDNAGLNQMVYNRCIGTRYCSQNCPYKVRRFNWFDYNQGELARPAPSQNPEVTVRGRGVMEKCTYCVQRINRASIDAHNAGQPLAHDAVQTACQQACPTRAIIFGDRNHADSLVAQLQQHPLSYGLLEELNTRPRTRYLTRVVNPQDGLEETTVVADTNTPPAAGEEAP